MGENRKRHPPGEDRNSLGRPLLRGVEDNRLRDSGQSPKAGGRPLQAAEKHVLNFLSFESALRFRDKYRSLKAADYLLDNDHIVYPNATKKNPALALPSLY